MKVGERYHYLQSPWEMIIEIAAINDENSIDVIIMQLIKPCDTTKVGKLETKWAAKKVGKYTLLPNQDKP